MMRKPWCTRSTASHWRIPLWRARWSVDSQAVTAVGWWRVVFDGGGGATDQGCPVEQLDLDAAGAPHLDALGDDERVAGDGAAVFAQVAGEGCCGCTGGGVFDDPPQGKGSLARQPPLPVGATSCTVTQSCSRQRRCSASKSYDKVASRWISPVTRMGGGSRRSHRLAVSLGRGRGRTIPTPPATGRATPR